MKPSVLLRPLENKDAPFILEWLKDEEVTRFFRFDTSNASIDSVLDFIADSKDRGVNQHFAITEADGDQYLGTVSLKNIDNDSKSAEYAISLRKKAQGKGIGYTATVKILEHAFYNLGLERVYLNVLSDNTNAVDFYTKFGFVYEGEFLNHIKVRNQSHSLKWYRLMKAEYECIAMPFKVPTVDDVRLLEFAEFGDDTGHLTVIEGCKDVPFNIKRAFYIYSLGESSIRGQHANKKSAFCLICLKGSYKVKVVDVVGEERIFTLDRPNMGLYLPPMLWKDMYDFSSDAVGLVLSSEHYDGGEYIKNLDEFLRRDRI